MVLPRGSGVNPSARPRKKRHPSSMSNRVLGPSSGGAHPGSVQSAQPRPAENNTRAHQFLCFIPIASGGCTMGAGGGVAQLRALGHPPVTRVGRTRFRLPCGERCRPEVGVPCPTRRGADRRSNRVRRSRVNEGLAPDYRFRRSNPAKAVRVGFPRGPRATPNSLPSRGSPTIRRRPRRRGTRGCRRDGDGEPAL